jgi:hypothetical protein
VVGEVVQLVGLEAAGVADVGETGMPLGTVTPTAMSPFLSWATLAIQGYTPSSSA